MEAFFAHEPSQIPKKWVITSDGLPIDRDLAQDFIALEQRGGHRPRGWWGRLRQFEKLSANKLRTSFLFSCQRLGFNQGSQDRGKSFGGPEVQNYPAAALILPAAQNDFAL